MIVTTALVLSSYSFQTVALGWYLTNLLKFLVPDWTTDLIRSYPDAICSLFTIFDFIGFIPVSISASFLLVAKSLKGFCSSLYASLNHDKISKYMVLIIPVCSLLTFLSQFGTCHHVCRDGMFINFYEQLNSSNNITSLTFDSDVTCWIPWVETSFCLSFLILLVKICLHVIYSQFCRGIHLKLKRHIVHPTSANPEVYCIGTSQLEDENIVIPLPKTIQVSPTIDPNETPESAPAATGSNTNTDRGLPLLSLREDLKREDITPALEPLTNTVKRLPVHRVGEGSEIAITPALEPFTNSVARPLIYSTGYSSDDFSTWTQIQAFLMNNLPDISIIIGITACVGVLFFTNNDYKDVQHFLETCCGLFVLFSPWFVILNFQDIVDRINRKLCRRNA